MKDFDYQHWLAVASRFSRRKSEASDLLHDALLDAIRADRTDFALASTQRWFAGVLRNRAAMIARTAARRKSRERIVRDRVDSTRITPARSFIESLVPSARSVATLIVAGLNRDEIMAALNIAPTAFRQRLTAIRKAWGKVPHSTSDDELPANDHPDLGLMRRALLVQVRRGGGVGTHDPDGHLLIISDDQTSQSAGRRQQKQKKEKR